MNKRFFRDFLTQRRSAWTFGLCLTGVLVLGTIVAVDSTRRDEAEQPETAMEQAYLQSESDDSVGIGDMALADADGAQAETEQTTEQAVDASSGSAIEDGVDSAPEESGQTEASESEAVEEETEAGTKTEEVSSANVISEEDLLAANVVFNDTDTLLWPAAGTILIDYSMDASVYFPTLDQYKYSPALVIGSEAGNKVISAARGIVESVDVDEVRGLTMTVNIGNGYRLTYGQLKEAAVGQGDLVEAGSVLGYVSEPTRFYTKEGSNLYFQMTKDGAPVDPVLYLE